MRKLGTQKEVVETQRQKKREKQEICVFEALTEKTFVIL